MNTIADLARAAEKEGNWREAGEMPHAGHFPIKYARWHENLATIHKKYF